MICVIFTSKLEIPEDGNDVLDDVLDVKQFWYKVYSLSVGDFDMLIRLVIQIIYISWKRNIKRVLSAVSLIFVIFIYLFYLSMFH